MVKRSLLSRCPSYIELYTAISDVCVFYINIILCATYSWSASCQYCLITDSHVPCFPTFWNNINFSLFTLQVITRQQKTVFESWVLFGSDCSQFLKFEFCNGNLEILCSYLQLTHDDDTTIFNWPLTMTPPSSTDPWRWHHRAVSKHWTPVNRWCSAIPEEWRDWQPDVLSVRWGTLHTHLQLVAVILLLLRELDHVSKEAVYGALHCH